MTPAPWRVGRKLGRTLYERKYTDGPSDDDRFLGVMDTPEDARRVVDAVNAVDRVRALHHRIKGPVEVGQPDERRCEACLEIHPCATLRALGGDDA